MVSVLAFIALQSELIGGCEPLSVLFGNSSGNSVVTAKERNPADYRVVWRFSRLTPHDPPFFTIQVNTLDSAHERIPINYIACELGNIDSSWTGQRSFKLKNISIGSHKEGWGHASIQLRGAEQQDRTIGLVPSSEKFFHLTSHDNKRSSEDPNLPGSGTGTIKITNVGDKKLCELTFTSGMRTLTKDGIFYAGKFALAVSFDLNAKADPIASKMLDSQKPELTDSQPEPEAVKLLERFKKVGEPDNYVDQRTGTRFYPVTKLHYGGKSPVGIEFTVSRRTSRGSVVRQVGIPIFSGASGTIQLSSMNAPTVSLFKPVLVDQSVVELSFENSSEFVGNKVQSGTSYAPALTYGYSMYVGTFGKIVKKSDGIHIEAVSVASTKSEGYGSGSYVKRLACVLNPSKVDVSLLLTPHSLTTLTEGYGEETSRYVGQVSDIDKGSSVPNGRSNSQLSFSFRLPYSEDVIQHIESREYLKLSEVKNMRSQYVKGSVDGSYFGLNLNGEEGRILLQWLMESDVKSLTFQW